MKRERKERARVVVRRGKGGEKRERERDNKDGGPLRADAGELILCSIHCVMAASSLSAQS